MDIKKGLKKIAAVSMLASMVAGAKSASAISIGGFIDALATMGGLGAVADLGVYLATGEHGAKKLLTWAEYSHGFLNDKDKNEKKKDA